MFRKLLIANRGEIACRIAKTATEMGIATVAVYSDADADAQHVRRCDEAVRIGSSPASDSYLCIEKILSAARQTGADAIHPGYGFLSENADFAKQCEARQITFIGPPAEAILKMASKSTARQIARMAGVPVLPGYDGPHQDSAILQDKANKIGYPLLIKAEFGGGGKGMRIVARASDFLRALESVKRESLSAFADDRVLLERYLPTTRHIEIQIFADTHGQVVHLFERDCSLQRRHQKVLEEAPAPMITDPVREAMTQAAIACVREIDYVGAGTIEFLLAPDNQFYFMEMNTRLQVEHPVTERITGQDLVEWQIRVADGERLPCQQSELQLNGHAIEARIYAENTDQDFLPSAGTLDVLSLPALGPSLRIDTGVVQGDEISVHYDSLISKLICWGETRATALQRMHRALQQYQLIGVHHNIALLGKLVSHPQIVEGNTDTRFIENQLGALRQPEQSLPNEVLFSVCCYDLLRAQHQTAEKQKTSTDPWSPWALCDHWQSTQRGSDLLCYHDPAGNRLEVRAVMDNRSIHLTYGAKTYCLRARYDGPHDLTIEYAHHRIKTNIMARATQRYLLYNHRLWQLDKVKAGNTQRQFRGPVGTLRAPMPGSVVAVQVKENETVVCGDHLMIIEAMKMEHQINSPRSGRVTTVYFQTGDQVNEGDILLVID